MDKILTVLFSVSALWISDGFSQQWVTLLEDSIGFVYSTSSDQNMMVLSDQLATRSMPNQVYLFDGFEWSAIADSTIGQGGNPIRGACRYQGVPYCYHYSSVNGSGVFRFNGSAWILQGEMPNGGVHGMKVYNDTLYVFGSFREINGDTNLRHIVKYDGNQFYPVGTPLFFSTTASSLVRDIHFYQGELYVTGRLKTNSGKYHVARWNGQQWNDVGDGFPYSSYPSKLLEYNGYLLINQHPVSYSGTANGLVAWDGQQYHGMGKITCDHLAGVSHMTVHDGKLWVSGDCSDDPGFHHYFASYDGERWCQYDFVESAKYMTVFQDRMYAYLLHYPNGPVHRFVRWLDETEPDWCGEPVYIGIEKAPKENSNITIYPNPTNSTTTIQLPSQNTQNQVIVNLYDVHGRLLYVPTVINAEKVELNLSGLPSGMYFGQLQTESETHSFKVVRE